MTTVTSSIAAIIWKTWNPLHILFRYFSCDASLSQSRDAMLSCRDVWARRSGYATAAVTIGVVLEAPEVVFALKWYIRKAIDRTFMRRVTNQKAEPGWFALVGAVGLLLVILGVAGEWEFDEKLSGANATLSNFDHGQTLEAQKQAGDAKLSAESAASAAERANDSATELEVRLLQTGHRNLMLLAKEKEMVSALRKFSGQRFIAISCSKFTDDPETSETRMAIWGILSAGAKWKMEPDITFNVCTAGIGVHIRASNSPSSIDAAKALAKTLNEVLGKYRIGKYGVPQVALSIDSPPIPPRLDGLESVGPNTILILVGSHP